MVSVGDAIRIAITGDGTKAVNEFKKVGAAADQNLKKAQSSSEKLGSTLTKVGVGAVGAGLAIGAGLFKAAEAASEADLAQRKLQNTIQNSPKLVGANAEAFNRQADALEKVTVYSHVQTTTIQALLGQYKLTQTQVLQLTPLVEDFASKMGIDTVSAAKAVGKAVEGTGGGLQRYGIITGVTKTGTHNFDLTMQALRKTVGGFSISEGKTFTGQLTIMKNELKHTEEEIGRGAIPVMKEFGHIVGGAADIFLKMDDATGGAVGKFAAYGAAALIAGGALSVVVGSATSAATALGVLAATEDGLALTTGGLIGGSALGILGLAYVLGNLGGDVDTTILSTKNLETTFDNAASSASSFAQAVSKGSTALQNEARTEIEKWLADTKGAPAVLNAAGVSFDDYYAAITKGGKSFDEVRGKLDAYLHSLQIASSQGKPNPQAQANASQVIDALKNSAGAYSDATAAGKIYAKSVADNAFRAKELADQALPKLNKRIVDGGHYYSTYSSAAIAAEIATGKAGATASKTADDYYAIRRAVDDATNAMFSQADAADKVASDGLKLGDDLQTVKDDTKAFHDELHKSGPASDATRSAYRKVQEDLLNVSGDLRGGEQDAIAYAVSLTHGAKDATDAIKNHASEFVTSLHTVAGTLAPGSQARVFLDQYAAKIATGIPSKKTTKVTLDTTDAYASLDSYENSLFTFLSDLGIHMPAAQIFGPSTLGGTPGGGGGGGGGGTVQRRAGGGPVEADKRYVVGEQGPELFVPKTAGTIVPHGKMRSYGSAAGSVNHHYYHLTVVSIDPKQAGAAVVDALRAYNRDRGAIPVKVA